MDPVSTLCLVAVVAIIALPISVFATLWTASRHHRDLLAHLEATQMYGGTPAALVKQQHAQQHELNKEQIEMERERLDELRQRRVEPDAVLGG